MAKELKKRKSVREVFAGEEVALSDLFTLFTERKRYVFISAGVFFVLGILVAVTSPVEYEAEAQILSEDTNAASGSSLGGLAGLAGLAGLSIGPDGAQNVGLSPEMYPEIAASQPFLLDLMQEKFFFQENGKEMTLEEYFLEERPGHIFSKAYNFLRGVPGRFFALFDQKKQWNIPSQSDIEVPDSVPSAKKPRIINIDGSQLYVIEQLRSRIVIEAEGKIIGVKVKMPEPYISAQLNSIVLEEVIDYVVAYKTNKQRQNLEFIEGRTAEAEQKFKQAQLNLARFRDANQGIISQTAKTQEDLLESEFSLAAGVYNGLAQQLEQTKIQLKKETPLFTEFEPVTIPLGKAEPSVPRILIMYLAMGIFFGGVAIIVSIVRDYRSERVSSVG